MVSPLLADIDECERANGNCEHFCNNTDGGYYCYCARGFQLGPNGLNCYGNSTPQSYISKESPG